MFEINGVVWRIILVSPDHPALIQPNGRKAIGCCDRVDKTIYISAAAAHQPLLTQILIHEIAHAAIYSYNIDLPIDVEENVASFISIYGEEILNIADSFV